MIVPIPTQSDKINRVKLITNVTVAKFDVEHYKDEIVLVTEN